jgi:hypothetical protein
MPDPATTPAHEGGEREFTKGAVELLSHYLQANSSRPLIRKEVESLARDWLAMDAEITRLKKENRLVRRLSSDILMLVREVAPDDDQPMPSRADLDAIHKGVIDRIAKMFKGFQDDAGTSADAGARDRLRAFIASLKAKAQQSIIILPRHFEAFERGETVL